MKESVAKILKQIGISTLICFLFTFMLFIFGPTEIFFANHTEFEFVYSNFAPKLVIYGIILTVLPGIFIGLLPNIANKIINAIVLGFSIAGYIQIMFMNKHLDLMGLNADGYHTTTVAGITNICIWIVIIAGCIFLAVKVQKNQVLAYIAGALVLIQAVAMISLLATGTQDCYEYPETEYHLSGDEQFILSSNKNTVVFVLDCFSNVNLNNAIAAAPDCIAPFHDFTRYDNDDCVYYGTFPSLTHMFTHDKYDFTLTVNDWTKRAWTSDSCNYFYDELQKNNISFNMHTPLISHLTGGNAPEELLSGKFTNFNSASLEREVNEPLLSKGMLKMSAYRMLPNFFKNNFYAQASDYNDAVHVIDDSIMHENYDFINALEEKGLSVKDCPGMISVNHLMGTHVYQNDELGYYKDDATADETSIGCLNVVSEYLDEMKRLNIYDNATIIITADHGSEYGQVPIFLIKQPGETHDDMPINTAPISHMDLLGTLAASMDIDSTPIGTTIYDFNPGDLRERTFYLRDNMDEYPRVPCYTGDKEGGSNVFVAYTYAGTEQDLLALLFDYYTDVYPMVDCYY